MKLLEATLESKRAKTEDEVGEILSCLGTQPFRGNTAVGRLRVGKHEGTVLKRPQPFLRVEMEAMILAAGPGVPELVSWNDNSDLGVSYILLRSVGEQNLRDYLRYEDEPPLPGATAAEVTRGKAEGRLVREGLLYQLLVILRRLHAAGIMHGDVDAPHVVLSDAGDVTGFSDEVRIVDFGGSEIAQWARGGQADPKGPLHVAYTKEGRRDNLDPFVTMETILGCAGCGSGKSDGKLRDLYAFGALALRLFDSDIFRKQPVGMPERLEHFVNGVTTMDPTERFAPHADLERHPWVEEMSVWTAFKQGRISDCERQRRISVIDAAGLVHLDMLVTQKQARAARAAAPNVDSVFQYLTLPLPQTHSAEEAGPQSPSEDGNIADKAAYRVPDECLFFIDRKGDRASSTPGRRPEVVPDQGSPASVATESIRAVATVAVQGVGAGMSPPAPVAPHAARRVSRVVSGKWKPRAEGKATVGAAAPGFKRTTKGDSLVAPAKRRKAAKGGVLHHTEDAEYEARSAVTNGGAVPAVEAAAGPAGPGLDRGAESTNLERLVVGATISEDVEMSPKGSDVEGDGLAATATDRPAVAIAAAVAMSHNDTATGNNETSVWNTEPVVPGTNVTDGTPAETAPPSASEMVDGSTGPEAGGIRPPCGPSRRLFTSPFHQHSARGVNAAHDIAADDGAGLFQGAQGKRKDEGAGGGAGVWWGTQQAFRSPGVSSRPFGGARFRGENIVSGGRTYSSDSSRTNYGFGHHGPSADSSRPTAPEAALAQVEKSSKQTKAGQQTRTEALPVGAGLGAPPTNASSSGGWGAWWGTPAGTGSFAAAPSSNDSSAVGAAGAVQGSGAAPWDCGGGYGRAAVAATGTSLHKSLLDIIAGKVGSEPEPLHSY